MFWLENSDKKWRRQSYTKKYLARLFHIVPCQVKSQSCQNFQIQNQSTLNKIHSCFLDSCFCSRLAQRKNRSSLRKSIQNIFFLFKLWKHLLLCAQKFNWCCWSILKIKIHLQCWSGTPKNKPPWNLLRCYWILFIIGRWQAFDLFGSYFLLINPAFKARKITQMLL